MRKKSRNANNKNTCNISFFTLFCSKWLLAAYSVPPQSNSITSTNKDERNSDLGKVKLLWILPRATGYSLYLWYPLFVSEHEKANGPSWNNKDGQIRGFIRGFTTSFYINNPRVLCGCVRKKKKEFVLQVHEIANTIYFYLLCSDRRIPVKFKGRVIDPQIEKSTKKIRVIEMGITFLFVPYE